MLSFFVTSDFRFYYIFRKYVFLDERKIPERGNPVSKNINLSVQVIYSSNSGTDILSHKLSVRYC